MIEDLRIGFFGSDPEMHPLVGTWLRAEWPSWYGSDGEGDLEGDLRAYTQIGSVPTALVSYLNDEPCGFMALKTESIPGYNDRAPWVGAGFVLPHLRGRGIGGRLLGELEVEARKLGHAHIYAGTVRANTLLQRAGWQMLGATWHDGKNVNVYTKAL